jgi:hypothetical protein
MAAMELIIKLIKMKFPGIKEILMIPIQASKTGARVKHEVAWSKGGAAEIYSILDITVPIKVGIRKLQNYPCNSLNAEI